MKLWLDDLRKMPEGYDLHVKTASEAIRALIQHSVEEISLDHDLGLRGGTGYHVALYIEEEAFYGNLRPLKWHLHSSNPVGVKKMRDALENADKYWAEKL